MIIAREERVCWPGVGADEEMESVVWAKGEMDAD